MNSVIIQKIGGKPIYTTDTDTKERAILISLLLPHEDEVVKEASLKELVALCEACDIEVLSQAIQKRAAADAATAVGSGKIEELRVLAESLKANCLIYDGELSGSQMAKIADLSNLKVLDRKLLILDIFARRAKSREGVLQVEIAQLQDRLTRLKGSGQSLSRLGGGIGTRGPGESQLESDRRHIQRRISTLKRKLKDMDKRRDLERLSRRQRSAYVIAICGYTNAGKSSLINVLCQSDLLAFNQVFATLDPALRRLPLDGPEILLADTVGLIRNLPHELVEAFKSTIEEICYADLIIQVTDVSDPEADKQIEVVQELLQDLEIQQKAKIHVLNKIDKLPAHLRPEQAVHYLPSRGQSEVAVSVEKGWGIPELQACILQELSQDWRDYSFTLNYQQQELLPILEHSAFIKSLHYTVEGCEINLRAAPAIIKKLQHLLKS